MADVKYLLIGGGLASFHCAKNIRRADDEGSILMVSEDAARHEGFRRLDLVATLPGISLYQACGFVPTAEIEDVVLADGVRLPCLAMSKEIVPDVV